MAQPQIKFGTDGWRGLIADDFTFANVRTAAEAIAAYIHAKEDAAKGLCIGYDTRFGSKAFARACAEVAAATGIPVMLANAVTPTPALSWGVRERGAAGGIMITSSHNPAQWNGVKYKAWYGGSGKPSIIAEIESYLGNPAPRAAKPATIQEVDFLPTYLKAIESFADLDLIAKSGMKFCIDSMYGAGGTIIADIFARVGVAHVQIRSESRSAFSGHQSRAYRAAHPRPGRGGGGQRLPGRPVHGRRRGPHRRDRRGRRTSSIRTRYIGCC